MSTSAISLILAAHIAGAVAAALVGSRRPRISLLVAGIAPLMTVGWLVSITSKVLDGQVITQSAEWVPQLNLAFEFRIDSFGLLMAWLVAGIGTLIFIYAYAYFDTSNGRLAALGSTLVLFAGSMLGVVLSDDVFTLFLFWELTSVTSFLLIGFKHDDDAARASALQALLVTASGGFALLAGLILVSIEAGTTRISDWLANPPSGGYVTAGVVLILIGAATKSAQFPFHFWLPGAMAAPTPVSAYLHSATMVKAGVYIVARFAPAFAAVGVWRPMILSMGAASMLVGGAVALRRTDLKQILAYGTISQLGFLMILFGAGDPGLTSAGVAMLLAHALFKAPLFMIAGVIDHNAGSRDIRCLQSMATVLPVLAVLAGIAGASMAGIPPLFGFISKETALAGFGHSDFSSATLMLIVVIAGSVLTAAYTLRLWFGAFGDAGLDERTSESNAFVDHAEVHKPHPLLWLPAAVLVSLTAVAGLFPKTVETLVNTASLALDPAAETHELKLWHGLNAELGFSALIVILGVAIHLGRRQVRRTVPSLPMAIRGENVFGRIIHGLVVFSERQTAVVQPGSLPHYMAVICLTIIALPGVALATGGMSWPEEMVLYDSPIELFASIFIVIAAFVGTSLRDRMATVLAVGAVGSAVGVMFIVAGGPDLALTQLLVETVALVALILVLRHLPSRYTTASLKGFAGLSRRVGLVVISLGVAAVICGLAVSALNVRTAEPVGLEALELSKSEGGGANVVNVILADFRGLDTLGEITVLAIAAIGSLGLIGVGIGTRRKPGTIDDPAMGAEVELDHEPDDGRVGS